MRKFYSIVLMATALLIGTNAWATSQSDIQAVFTAGGDITLTSDVDLTDPLQIKEGKTVNLKLAGFTISNNSSLGQKALIELYKGTLNITNSDATKGGIATTANCEAIKVFGSTEDVADWSILNIGANVKISSTSTATGDNLKANAISVLETSGGHAAFGVKINVLSGAFVYGDKYGIKINGNINVNGVNIPTVYIAHGAEVKAAATTPQAAAVYSSGYGKFVIEGSVHGSTGVYVKGGQVVVEDGAEIKSDNNTGSGIEQIGKGSGIDAGGNAIAIEGRNASYTSDGLSVQINGGTITAGNGAYAVQNLNNNYAQDVPTAVTISGGEFNGGQIAGCIAIDNSDPEHPVDVELTGGTFTGDIATLIAATSDGDNIIQGVVSQEGGQATVVIGKKETGDAVVEGSDIEFVNNMSSAIVKLDATSADITKTLPAGETVVKYLSLTGTGSHTSTVTVEAGKTLKVGQIVMNANGRLIVEAGATLVVTGANGIFADNVENLVLETEEGNHSSFLLHPSVANNQHPKATVQFVSKSYYVSSSDFRNQRFGIPTIGAVESVTAEYEGNPAPTRFAGYVNGSWEVIGSLNTSATFDPSVLNQPFAYYQMSNNVPLRGTIVTMTGNLVGIADPKLNLVANDWSTFANSFMGNLTGSAMMAMFEGHDDVDMSIRSYVPTSANNFIWQTFNFASIEFGEEISIEPMQAFIMKNNGAADQLQMSYKNMVWNPMFPDNKVLAPRRVAAASDLTTARVEVRSAAGDYDYVSLLAGDQFSAEYNNGYDAEKIMNSALNLYAVGTMNQAILATDNLDNTVLGLNCVEAGTYTISFSHINGEELTLIDHATGARVAMVEGATYEFTAGENTENDYRFEIVGRANMPTAIDNTEAVKSAKGVYTITGQYVGEMNVWNALPAGVYVVNGEKRVK